jgi:hypothetical protein
VLTTIVVHQDVECVQLPDTRSTEEKLANLFPSESVVILIKECKSLPTTDLGRESQSRTKQNNTNALVDVEKLLFYLSKRYLPIQQICLLNDTKWFWNKIKPSVKHNKYISSTIFILQVNVASKMEDFLEVSKTILHPKRLFDAKYFILNNAVEQPLLENPSLRNIPNKMELRKAVGTSDGSTHLLLWSYCNHCPNSTRFGSIKIMKGHILIGAFVPGKAYTSYSKWYPDLSKHFHGVSFVAIQPVPHKEEPNSVKFLKSVKNPYKILSEAVVQVFNAKLDENPVILWNYPFTVLDKGQTEDIGAQRMREELKGLPQPGFGTVLIRDKATDRHLQASTPYTSASYALAYFTLKPSLEYFIGNFLFSLRWVYLFGSVVIIACVVRWWMSRALSKQSEQNRKWQVFNVIAYCYRFPRIIYYYVISNNTSFVFLGHQQQRRCGHSVFYSWSSEY